MKKTTLEVENDYDFVLLGISCHIKDYRLCWALNKYLGTDFEKAEDFEIKNKKSIETAAFSQYIYDVEEQYKSYTLLSNRSIAGSIIPEQKQADYLLVLKGNFSDDDINNLTLQINSIDFVLTVFEIDVSTLKSKQNLLF